MHALQRGYTRCPQSLENNASYRQGKADNERYPTAHQDTMSARDAIPEFETTKAVKPELTVVDALAKLTAVAEGDGGVKDLFRSARAAHLLANYFANAARYRDAIYVLRTDERGDVKRHAKMHRAAEKAGKQFEMHRDSVVTYFVDDAAEHREERLTARHAAERDKSDAGLEALSEALHKSSETHQRARTKVLSAHGISKLA